MDHKSVSLVICLLINMMADPTPNVGDIDVRPACQVREN